MAAGPETEHGTLVQGVYTPVEGKYSNPMTLTPVNYDALQNAMQNATEAITKTAINPAVRAQMENEATQAKAAQKIAANPNQFLSGTRDGHFYQLAGAEGGKAYTDIFGPNVLGTQPYDPAKDPKNAPKTAAPQTTTVVQLNPPNVKVPNLAGTKENPKPLGSGDITHPLAAPAPPDQPVTQTAAQPSAPATSNQTNTANPPDTSAQPVQNQNLPADKPVTYSGPAQTGNMFAANNAQPPPAAPDQGAIDTALASTRVPSQGGDASTMSASTDNTFLMKQWQDRNAHPVMDSRHALDWAQSLDSGIKRAVYLPNGGPNGEPAYAFSSGKGANNIVPLSQMVQNGAGPLVASQNTSQVLSAADAASKAQQPPSMSLGATAQAPSGMEIPGTAQAVQPQQPPAAQPPPPGAPPPAPTGQLSDAELRGRLAQAGNVQSTGGPAPQYLSASASGANPPPAPVVDAAHPFHETITPYPNPKTPTEAETNRQVATGKVDKNGVATVGNATNNSVNLTNTDGMLHYTGMSSADVQAMADKAKANQYNLGHRENGDPYLGMSPSGRNYFMSDGGYAATSHPYTAEPGDTPFTEHRLYVGSDNWRDVTPPENQLKANLAAWDPSLDKAAIDKMQPGEMIARLREAYNLKITGVMDHGTINQLSALQNQINIATRMQHVIDSGLKDDDITAEAIHGNRQAGDAAAARGAKGWNMIPAAIGSMWNQAWGGRGDQPDPKISFLEKQQGDLVDASKGFNLEHEIPNFNQGAQQTKQQIQTFIANRSIDYQRILNGSLANKERADKSFLDYGNNLVQGKPNFDKGDIYNASRVTATHTNPVTAATPTPRPSAAPSATPNAPTLDLNTPEGKKRYGDMQDGEKYRMPGVEGLITKGGKRLKAH